MVVAARPLSQWACRRVEVKKAWAVHLAEQQQKQQQGSDAEEEEEARDPETNAVVAAEVPICHIVSCLLLSAILTVAGSVSEIACAVSCLPLLG